MEVAINYNRWLEYLEECQTLALRPSLKDYQVWLEEHDEELPEEDV